MIHSETGEAYKMNSHHVPLRQSVEETRIGKEEKKGDTFLLQQNQKRREPGKMSHYF